jgi:hypothetical protein
MLAFCLIVLVVGGNLTNAYAGGEKVAVIAPSVSTSMEARSIVRRLGRVESSLREAEAILVVVRSMLLNPLNYSYENINEL